MYADLLLSIEDLGRQYRYLTLAERALQQRLRALLRSVHAAAQDHDAPDVRGLAVVPAAFPVNGHAGGVNQATTAIPDSTVRQVGNHTRAVPQNRVVPAWLALTPRGMRREDWHPDVWLPRLPAAQLLFHLCTEFAAPTALLQRQLATLVTRLPIWQAWAKDIRGISAYGLGLLLAETRDLWRYGTVARLWKRLGLAVIAGERQRRIAGMSQQATLGMGYVAWRRSMVYNLEKGLLLQNQDPMTKEPGMYRRVYLERKVVEQAKLPDGTKQHWHRRASRYMAKRFLRDLWRAWRQTMPDEAGRERGMDQHQPVTQGAGVQTLSVSRISVTKEALHAP